MESVQAWLPADWLQPLSGLVAVVSGSALCQKLLPEALSVAFAAARERAGQASQPADFTALGPAPAGQAGPVLRYVGLPAQHVFPKRRKSHAAEYDTYGVDGVWKTAWLSKHRNDVPGLLVVAAEFDARMPAQHWAAVEASLASSINDIRDGVSARERGIEVHLVLVQSNTTVPLSKDDPLTSQIAGLALFDDRTLVDAAMDKVSSLRRRVGLEASAATIVYLSEVANAAALSRRAVAASGKGPAALDLAVGSPMVQLEALLRERALAHYAAQTRRLKRVLPVVQGSYLGRNGAAALGPGALLARLTLKLAAYQEARGRAQKTLKYYAAAYKVINGLPVTPYNHLELKALAEVVNWKIVCLYLVQGRDAPVVTASDATGLSGGMAACLQFASHVRAWEGRTSGPKDTLWQHWGWMTRQYQLMSTSLAHYGPPGPCPTQFQPRVYALSAALYAVKRRKAAEAAGLVLAHPYAAVPTVAEALPGRGEPERATGPLTAVEAAAADTAGKVFIPSPFLGGWPRVALVPVTAAPAISSGEEAAVPPPPSSAAAVMDPLTSPSASLPSQPVFVDPLSAAPPLPASSSSASSSSALTVADLAATHTLLPCPSFATPHGTDATAIAIASGLAPAVKCVYSQLRLAEAETKHALTVLLLLRAATGASTPSLHEAAGDDKAAAASAAVSALLIQLTTAPTTAAAVAAAAAAASASSGESSSSGLGLGQWSWLRTLAGEELWALGRPADALHVLEPVVPLYLSQRWHPQLVRVLVRLREALLVLLAASGSGGSMTKGEAARRLLHVTMLLLSLVAAGGTKAVLESTLVADATQLLAAATDEGEGSSPTPVRLAQPPLVSLEAGAVGAAVSRPSYAPPLPVADGDGNVGGSPHPHPGSPSSGGLRGALWRGAGTRGAASSSSTSLSTTAANAAAAATLSATGIVPPLMACRVAFGRLGGGGAGAAFHPCGRRLAAGEDVTLAATFLAPRLFGGARGSSTTTAASLAPLARVRVDMLCAGGDVGRLAPLLGQEPSSAAVLHSAKYAGGQGIPGALPAVIGLTLELRHCGEGEAVVTVAADAGSGFTAHVAWETLLQHVKLVAAEDGTASDCRRPSHLPPSAPWLVAALPADLRALHTGTAEPVTVTLGLPTAVPGEGTASFVVNPGVVAWRKAAGGKGTAAPGGEVAGAAPCPPAPPAPGTVPLSALCTDGAAMLSVVTPLPAWVDSSQAALDRATGYGPAAVTVPGSTGAALRDGAAAATLVVTEASLVFGGDASCCRLIAGGLEVWGVPSLVSVTPAEEVAAALAGQVAAVTGSSAVSCGMDTGSASNAAAADVDGESGNDPLATVAGLPGLALPQPAVAHLAGTRAVAAPSLPTAAPCTGVASTAAGTGVGPCDCSACTWLQSGASASSPCTTTPPGLASLLVARPPPLAHWSPVCLRLGGSSSSSSNPTNSLEVRAGEPTPVTLTFCGGRAGAAGGSLAVQVVGSGTATAGQGRWWLLVPPEQPVVMAGGRVGPASAAAPASEGWVPVPVRGTGEEGPPPASGAIAVAIPPLPPHHRFYLTCQLVQALPSADDGVTVALSAAAHPAQQLVATAAVIAGGEAGGTSRASKRLSSPATAVASPRASLALVPPSKSQSAPVAVTVVPPLASVLDTGAATQRWTGSGAGVAAAGLACPLSVAPAAASAVAWTLSHATAVSAGAPSVDLLSQAQPAGGSGAGEAGAPGLAGLLAGLAVTEAAAAAHPTRLAAGLPALQGVMPLPAPPTPLPAVEVSVAGEASSPLWCCSGAGGEAVPVPRRSLTVALPAAPTGAPAFFAGSTSSVAVDGFVLGSFFDAAASTMRFTIRNASAAPAAVSVALQHPAWGPQGPTASVLPLAASSLGPTDVVEATVTLAPGASHSVALAFAPHESVRGRLLQAPVAVVHLAETVAAPSSTAVAAPPAAPAGLAESPALGSVEAERAGSLALLERLKGSGDAGAAGGRGGTATLEVKRVIFRSPVRYFRVA